MAISTTFNPNAPAAKTGQGAAISNREDLSSVLTILAPEKTPLLSLCAKGKSTSTYHEWTLDKLAAVDTTGVQEGQDITTFENKFASRARVGNYVQTKRRSYLVSNLQQAVTSASPADIAAAELKAISELKRDVEAILCSDNEMTVENGASTPYAMRGLGKWVSYDAQSLNPVPSEYRTPTASVLTASPTETTLNDLIASIYTVSGESEALTLIAGVALRKVIAGFTRSVVDTTSGYQQVYNVTHDGTSKKIQLSVSMFESDFGVLSIMNGNADCLPDAKRGYVINPSKLAFNTLIPLSAKRLDDQGAGPRGFVEMTGTLVCKHPGAFGKIDY